MAKGGGIVVVLHHKGDGYLNISVDVQGLPISTNSIISPFM